MTSISQLPSSSSKLPDNQDEVLVKVEGVSKKFCRDLKKSLWYGVSDICSELNPFRTNVTGDSRLKLEDRAVWEIEDSRSDKGAQTSNSHLSSEASAKGELPTSASKAGSPSSISHLPSTVGAADTPTPNSHLPSSNQALDSDLRPQEFYAVRDVSFELRRGECLGLIGRNGAGKTTLLKMLNGLIKPDSGRIEMRGRIGALIALGAGFNPILTGRENVYVNGTVLGLTKKEIDAKFDEIVDFAEIGEFIDTPVRSYSSGMQVRLGFAVASTLDPDVLIIDEVLAVGDVGFRTKCYNRIYEVCKKAAVIFVSHNMPQIDRLCSRALVMEGGIARYDGETAPAIDRYNRLFTAESRDWQIAKGVSVDAIRVNGEADKRSFNITGGDSLLIEVHARFPKQVQELEVSVSFLEKSYDLISQANSRFRNNNLKIDGADRQIAVKIPEVSLGSGLKLMSVAVVDARTNEILIWAHGSWELLVSNSVYIPSPTYTHAAFQYKD